MRGEQRRRSSGHKCFWVCNFNISFVIWLCGIMIICDCHAPHTLLSERASAAWEAERKPV